MFLHGLIRDEFGRKMSKSKGNGIDPLDWVETFGADALRFTLARGASPGGDLSIGEDHARASRNFATKLFNATRFALMNGAAPAPLPAAGELTDADRWILGRLEEVRAEVDRALDRYEFSRACEALYHFAWDEFCDWYVELAKVQLAEGGARGHHQAVLAAVLDALLKLLHPVMPFVTETLWKALTGGESLVIAHWPQASGIALDQLAAQRIADMQKLVTEVRRFRSDQGLADRQKVPARLVGIGEADLAAQVPAVTSLAWLTEPADGLHPVCVGGGAAVRVARCRSNWTPRAPSTSPPSGAGWKRTWPPRRRNWPDRSQTRQRGVPGQGARRGGRPRSGTASSWPPKRSSGSPPGWPGWRLA